MKNLKNYLFAAILSIALFSSCNMSSSTVDLHASVRSSNKQLVITNKDYFDYDDLEVELNGRYKLKIPKIKAGEVYMVDINDFADSDGYRFGFNQKQQEITIWCKISGDRDGFLHGEMN